MLLLRTTGGRAVLRRRSEVAAVGLPETFNFKILQFYTEKPTSKNIREQLGKFQGSLFRGEGW